MSRLQLTFRVHREPQEEHPIVAVWTSDQFGALSSLLVKMDTLSFMARLRLVS